MLILPLRSVLRREITRCGAALVTAREADRPVCSFRNVLASGGGLIEHVIAHSLGEKIDEETGAVWSTPALKKALRSMRRRTVTATAGS